MDAKLNTGVRYFVMNVHFKSGYNKKKIRCDVWVKMFRQISKNIF